MFGIGLPELILIMAVALIVVGPEKLPELAKSLAKGVLELKKAANALKDSLNEGEDKKPWDQIEPDAYPPTRQYPLPPTSAPETKEAAVADQQQNEAEQEEGKSIGGEGAAAGEAAAQPPVTHGEPEEK